MKILNELNNPLIISTEEYLQLRNSISGLLLTFFDEITKIKDAAENEELISFVGQKDKWVAVNVFHCNEWYVYYKSGLLPEKFKARLATIKLQYAKATTQTIDLR